MSVPEDRGGEGESSKQSPGLCPQELRVSPKKGKTPLCLAGVGITHCSVALENSSKAWGTLSHAVPYPIPLCSVFPYRRPTHSDQFEKHGATMVINLD